MIDRIPAVAAGPGSIAQAHTADEWVSLAELERGVKFYRDFLEGIQATAPLHAVEIGKAFVTTVLNKKTAATASASPSSNWMKLPP